MANEEEVPVLDDAQETPMTIEEAIAATNIQGVPETEVDPQTGAVRIYLRWPPSYETKAGGSKPKTVKLEDLLIRRINGGDIRTVQSIKESEALHILVMRLAGIRLDEFDRLDALDIGRVGKVIEAFLPESLRTGKGSLVR